jgi:hypothetical protein
MAALFCSPSRLGLAAMEPTLNSRYLPGKGFFCEKIRHLWQKSAILSCNCRHLQDILI